MGKITINGVSYSGNNITVINGKVIIDGNDVTPNFKNIEILVDGNIDKLSVDSCDKLMVNGNVGQIKSTSGDVEVLGNIDGDVTSTSGDIKCGNISGSVKTVSGDIKYKKY